MRVGLDLDSKKENGIIAIRGKAFPKSLIQQYGKFPSFAVCTHHHPFHKCTSYLLVQQNYPTPTYLARPPHPPLLFPMLFSLSHFLVDYYNFLMKSNGIYQNTHATLSTCISFSFITIFYISESAQLIYKTYYLEVI